MSSISASFKRLSVGSANSAKSSNGSVSVDGQSSPLDVNFPLSPSPVLSFTSSSSNGNGYAEMLEDDNMSWGTRKPSSPHSKRSKRGNLRFF